MERLPMNPTDSGVPTQPAPAASTLHSALALTQPAAVQHAMTVQKLMAGWVTRTAGTGIKALTLAPFAADPQTWTELLQLQSAIVHRLQEQQQENMQGWAAWLQERAQLNRANTMSKLVEQEFDLLARFVLLLSDQMVNLVTLQENVEVNTGYWLGEQLAAKSA